MCVVTQEPGLWVGRQVFQNRALQGAGLGDDRDFSGQRGRTKGLGRKTQSSFGDADKMM